MKPTTRSTNSSNWLWAYERKAPASLQGFMAWLRAADTEVKRDMEISRDEVRVMTVHGAKGLEAPVVFLVDTTSSPADTQRLKLIHLPRGNAQPHAPGVVVWAGRKADDPAAVAAARTAMLEETEDEYRRLLYVAMTRAADRLIVGGCMPGNMNRVREFSWYDLIVKGLGNSGLQLREIETADGLVKRYSRPEDVTDAAAGAAAPPAGARTELPSWLRGAAPRGTAPPTICCARPIPPPTRVIRSGPASRSSCGRGRCCAARWCTGCCNPCPTSRPEAPPRCGAALSRPQRPRLDRRRPRGAG